MRAATVRAAVVRVVVVVLAGVAVLLVALPGLSRPDGAVPPIVTTAVPGTVVSVEVTLSATASPQAATPVPASPDDDGLMIDSGAALRRVRPGSAPPPDAVDDASP